MGDDSRLNHWADHAATRTIAAHPNADEYSVAAGITPSGEIHIGNFREVITVDFVARALRDRGVKARFVYSWDDFDVFRKVPVGMPQPEMLAENLRRSIADVPDPFGEHESYAAHHIAAFEASIEPLGIDPEFIRQHRRYRAGDYAEGIRKALAGADTIRGILNRAREANGATKLLSEDWLPLAGFCDACRRDELRFEWDGDWTVTSHCSPCGHVGTTDLRKGGNLKLPWRVDWPMRWAEERIAFEPGGKDHSSAGGSYDTAKDIVREIYDWTAPQYVGYDFVIPKGQGGKFSSSKGSAITVRDALEIYEPGVLRWLFASYRPNTEFQISFDLDVIKIYEDHDRAFRLAHQADDGGRSDKKRQIARRTMQLADVEHRPITPGTEPPARVPFRQLSVIVQIFDGDIDGTIAHYEKLGVISTAQERDSLRARARCVWNWVDSYAPEDFRYRIRSAPHVRDVEAGPRTLLERLVDFLDANPDADDQALGALFKTITDGTELELKQLYPVVYDLLIDRPKGPKLSTLISTMGSARALPLLRAGL